jgi:hypothetical protein
LHRVGINWVDLDLIITREIVHEEQSLMAYAVVDNLIDERHWKVVFGTGVIKIAKVHANLDSVLFLFNGYRVGNP